MNGATAASGLRHCDLNDLLISSRTAVQSNISRITDVTTALVISNHIREQRSSVSGTRVSDSEFRSHGFNTTRLF